MKGLMDRCVAREKFVDRLKERAEAAEMGLHELEAWREVQFKKLDLTKKALEELEGKAEVLKNMLKDKEGEISSLRKQVLQVKEDGKMKFCNSDAFLYELDDFFADGFNDCFPQPDSSILKALMSCSRTTLLPMLKVMGRLLFKMNKLNLLRMRAVLLRRPRRLIIKRPWTRRPLLTSNRF